MALAQRLKNTKVVSLCSFIGFLLLFLTAPLILSHISFAHNTFFAFFMLVFTAFISIGGLLLYVWNDLSLDERAKLFNHLFITLFAAALLGLLGSILFFDRVKLSYNRDIAHSDVVQQTELLGRTPPIAADFEFASRSYENAQQHRALIEDVLTASRYTDEIMAYLAAARTFGVDDSFVRDNGLLRRSDKRALLDAALRRSSDGDLAAQEWLLSNQKSLAAR